MTYCTDVIKSIPIKNSFKTVAGRWKRAEDVRPNSDWRCRAGRWEENGSRRVQRRLMSKD